LLKWVVGFVLALLLSNLLGKVDSSWGPYLGLFLAGLILGYWVHEGVWAGFFNAILSAVLLSLAIVAIVVFLNSYYGYGTVSDGLMSLVIAFIMALIIRGFFMGVGGAMGGLIANMTKNK
jgi:hypothetical protein